ncbi:hypothetical protein FQZ97_1212240 [compost metagenome]
MASTAEIDSTSRIRAAMRASVDRLLSRLEAETGARMKWHPSHEPVHARQGPKLSCNSGAFISSCK